MSLNVEVTWLLGGLKPHFRTSATPKAGAGGPQYHRVLPQPRHFRERGDPELGADRRTDSRELSCACGSGMPANATRSRAEQRWHLLPWLFRTANGRIFRLIFQAHEAGQPAIGSGRRRDARRRALRNGHDHAGRRPRRRRFQRNQFVIVTVRGRSRQIRTA